VYSGRVGTGFNQRTLELMQQILLPKRIENNPMDVGGPPVGARFVRSDLVCEVTFREWTLGGEIRAPIVSTATDRHRSGQRDTRGVIADQPNIEQNPESQGPGLSPDRSLPKRATDPIPSSWSYSTPGSPSTWSSI